MRRLAGDLGQRLDQLGPPVEQTDAVVGRVGGRQGAVRDQTVQQRSALLLGVVVDAVGVRQQRQARCDRPQVGTERVGRPADVPADRPRRDAGQDHAGLPCLAHRGRRRRAAATSPAARRRCRPTPRRRPGRADGRAGRRRWASGRAPGATPRTPRTGPRRRTPAAPPRCRPVAVARKHTRGRRPETPASSTAYSVSGPTSHGVRRPATRPPDVARMVGASAGMPRN